jgi:hypothetical protein
MEPFRVELSDIRPGHSYGREIQEREVGVFDATEVPVELVTWIVESLSREMQRLGLEVVK